MVVAGATPKLAISREDSLGEHVQRALPDAKVVKALNIIGPAKRTESAGTSGLSGQVAGATVELSPLWGRDYWPDCSEARPPTSGPPRRMQAARWPFSADAG